MTSIDQVKCRAIEMALKSGDFITAMPLIKDVKDETKDETLTLQLLNKCTPLHYACQHGKVDIVEELITKYNFSIERKDDTGYTPLHIAAQYGHLNVFECLLANLQSELDDYVDNEGNTPSHIASRHGCLDIITYLFSKEIGCSQNKTNKEGLSCLHLAAQHGHFPVVRYL